jgi:hypothetical protein
MTDAATPGRIRTSDAERERVAARLRDAMGEGRLTLDEGEQRLIATYAATYRDELTGLTTDLPAAEPGPGHRRGATRADRGGAGVAGADLAGAGVAGAGVARRAGGTPACATLGRHATGVFAVAALLIGVWAVSGAAFFWPAIPLGFLVVGLIKHAGMRRHGYLPPGARSRYRHGIHGA